MIGILIGWVVRNHPRLLLHDLSSLGPHNRLSVLLAHALILTERSIRVVWHFERDFDVLRVLGSAHLASVEHVGVIDSFAALANCWQAHDALVRVLLHRLDARD